MDDKCPACGAKYCEEHKPDCQWLIAQTGRFVRDYDTRIYRTEQPQASGDITICLSHHAYNLTPKPTCTGYQAALIAKFLTVCMGNHGALKLDDAFAEVYSKTAEHWTKTP